MWFNHEIIVTEILHVETSPDVSTVREQGKLNCFISLVSVHTT